MTGLLLQTLRKTLEKKIDYYLDNECERVSIASRGRDFVMKNHTNEVRALEILREFKNR